MKTIINIKIEWCGDLNVENNDRHHKFEVVEHVRISKYKNIFGNGYTPNWSEEVKKKRLNKNVKKLKILYHCHM